MGPCPFCKSINVTGWTETDGNHMVTDAWFECDDCFARGPNADTEDDAALKWNAATDFPDLPPKMLVDADWLRRKVETDPDMDADVLPELPQGSAGSEPVAYRWRSIFNEGSWSFGEVRPPEHEQYITEPLFAGPQDVDAVTGCADDQMGFAVLNEPQEAPNRENLRPFAEWADRNRSAVSHEAADELILLARKACDAYGPLSRPRLECGHDWKIWPETDGQSQRCMKCGEYRATPAGDRA